MHETPLEIIGKIDRKNIENALQKLLSLLSASYAFNWIVIEIAKELVFSHENILK